MVKTKRDAGSLVPMRCRTCRARKIRCGNEQPSCHQCLRSGRKCAGYNSWEVTLRSSGRQQNDGSLSGSMSPQSVINQETIIRESTTMAKSPRTFLVEMNVGSEVWQAFDYFRRHSCNAYASRGYPTSWSAHALATSNTSPAVFYAVAALGALETSMLDMVHSSLARPALSAEMNLALRLYSAAIGHLSVSITDARQGEKSLEDIIVACVIFVVFEVTRGNQFIAGRHARVGNRILNERLGLMSNENGPSSDRSQPGFTLADLNYDFTFSSFEDALYHLEALMDAGHEFQARLLRHAEDLVDTDWAFLVSEKPASRFCLINSLSRTMALSTWSREDLRGIQRGHVQWKKAFAQLLSVQRHPSRNAVRLMVRSFVARTTMSLYRAPNEDWTSAYIEEFHGAFQAAELLVQWQNSDIPVAEDLIRRLNIAEHTSQRPAESPQWGWDEHPAPMGPFSPYSFHLPHAAGVFGQGVFQTLFTVACKCRDPVLRRKAADLLTSSNRMEGHHSGQRLGQYAHVVIALEEHLASRESSSSHLDWNDIPEAARLSDVVLSSPIGKDVVCLSCIRHPQGSSETFLLEEYCYTSHDTGTEQPTFELLHAFHHPMSASEPLAEPT